MDLVSMHGKLNEILFGEMIAGRRFVLIVDEAQNLEDSVLETVRLLSNFETSYAKMLQIVLAGQPQLSDKLAHPAACAATPAAGAGRALGAALGGGNGQLH